MKTLIIGGSHHGTFTDFSLERIVFQSLSDSFWSEEPYISDTERYTLRELLSSSPNHTKSVYVLDGLPLEEALWQLKNILIANWVEGQFTLGGETL